MSDPVADLFHRAEGTTLIQARPIESILPRQQGARRSPHGVSRLVAVVAAVAVVVAGTGLVVSRVIGNGGVRTSPPAAPSTTHSPSVVAPTGSGSATAGLFHVPSGFLDPADLGAGDWAADPNESSATGASPNLVSCEGAAQLQSATGPSQTYRGITTEGGEWLLIETVIQLDPTRSAQAATVLKAMTGCPARFNQVLLAADDQIVVFGRLQPSGAVGQAMSIALVGGRYLQLDTLPGGAAGNLDLPGQTQWLVDTAAKAVARATGVTPSKPAPNATAKAAAAKYRADSGAVVYFPSPGAGGGTPTGSQAGTPKAQVGLNAALLTAEELTGAAPWAGAVEPAGTPPVGGVQGIPHCSGSSMPVEGPAVSRVFRLTPSSGSSLLTWTVVERVAEVSPKQAQAATAMIAADTCTGEGSFLWLHLAGPAVAVVAPNSGGGYARLKVWSLVGTRVVSIEVYADSDPASASQALDPQWLPALVDAARRAAG